MAQSEQATPSTRTTATPTTSATTATITTKRCQQGRVSSAYSKHYLDERTQGNHEIKIKQEKSRKGDCRRSVGREKTHTHTRYAKDEGWRTWIALQDQRTRACLCGKERKNGRVLSWQIGVVSRTGGALCKSEKGVATGRQCVAARRGNGARACVGRMGGKRGRRRSGYVDAALLTLLWPTRTARGHDGVVVVGVLVATSTLTCTSSTRALERRRSLPALPFEAKRQRQRCVLYPICGMPQRSPPPFCQTCFFPDICFPCLFFFLLVPPPTKAALPFFPLFFDCLLISSGVTAKRRKSPFFRSFRLYWNKKSE